jgi:DNA-binding CsgD family transcriptional regulator
VQEEARSRIQRATSFGLAPARLAGAIATALQTAVPCDGYRWFGIDPRTLLVNRLLAASDDDGWARTEWLREVYLAAGPLAHIELPNLMRARLRAVAFQDRQDRCWGFPREMLTTLDERAHYRHFHDLRSPVGGTMLATFAADDQPVAALQWYRREPNQPFRAGEIAFVNQLAQAIGNAIAASLARERAMRQGDVPEASGILMLTPGGEVGFGTPAGERWRDLLGQIDRGTGDRLPTAVRAAVAALRASDDDGIGVVSGVGAVSLPIPGGSVRIEASSAGPDGSVAIVLAAERPPAPASVPVTWPLTPQERQVVDLLIQGQSNRQISDRLFVSEHTVEWHLRHAYEKIGVRSRNQLLSRLFHEVYLPGVTDLDVVGGNEPIALPSRQSRVA